MLGARETSAAVDALGRNPVWPGSAENNEEGKEDSGYE